MAACVLSGITFFTSTAGENSISNPRIDDTYPRLLGVYTPGLPTWYTHIIPGLGGDFQGKQTPHRGSGGVWESKWAVEHYYFNSARICDNSSSRSLLVAISALTFSHECMTVVWSRPPSFLPIAGYDT